MLGSVSYAANRRARSAGDFALSGRRSMSYLHAAYSAGAVAGAVGAGALVGAGADYRLVYLAFLLAPAALVAALLASRLPVPGDRESGAEAPVPGGATAGRWGLYRSAPLLLVAAVGALALLSEGQMGAWSGIYLRDALGLGALLGGSGVAVFYAAIAAGRFGTGRVVGRLGNRRTLMAAGLLAAAGMALALATTLPLLAVAGFLLVGLAVAGAVPVAYSAAGDLAPGRAGSAVSVVSTLGYGGFLLGPPLVGGLAELVGLRGALGVIAVAGFARSDYPTPLLSTVTSRHHDVLLDERRMPYSSARRKRKMPLWATPQTCPAYRTPA